MTVLHNNGLCATATKINARDKLSLSLCCCDCIVRVQGHHQGSMAKQEKQEVPRIMKPVRLWSMLSALEDETVIDIGMALVAHSASPRG